MSDAPDKIFATPDTSDVSDDWKMCWYHGHQKTGRVEYTRSDLIPAMIAKARAEGCREGLYHLKDIVDDCCFQDSAGNVNEIDHREFERRFYALLDAEAPAQPTPDAVHLPRPEYGSTWTLDPGFVERVTREINRDGWEATMEVVELAMLAAERALAEGDSHE